MHYNYLFIDVYLREQGTWVYMERDVKDVFSKPYIGLSLEDFLMISNRIREVRDYKKYSKEAKEFLEKFQNDLTGEEE